MKKIVTSVLLSIAALTVSSQTPITIGKYATQHGPENGSLVIVGGGGLPDVILDSIVQLAGGKGKAKFVIVSTQRLSTSLRSGWARTISPI